MAGSYPSQQDTTFGAAPAHVMAALQQPLQCGDPRRASNCSTPTWDHSVPCGPDARACTECYAAYGHPYPYPYPYPYAGPNNYPYAGPNNNAYAGPNNCAYAGPNNYPYAGPNNYAYVGPNNYAYAGPNNYPYAGPNSYAYVGPNSYAYAYTHAPVAAGATGQQPAVPLLYTHVHANGSGPSVWLACEPPCSGVGCPPTHVAERSAPQQSCAAQHARNPSPPMMPPSPPQQQPWRGREAQTSAASSACSAASALPDVATSCALEVDGGCIAGQGAATHVYGRPSAHHDSRPQQQEAAYAPSCKRAAKRARVVVTQAAAPQQDMGPILDQIEADLMRMPRQDFRAAFMEAAKQGMTQRRAAARAQVRLAAAMHAAAAERRADTTQPAQVPAAASAAAKVLAVVEAPARPKRAKKATPAAAPAAASVTAAPVATAAATAPAAPAACEAAAVASELQCGQGVRKRRRIHDEVQDAEGAVLLFTGMPVCDDSGAVLMRDTA